MNHGARVWKRSPTRAAGRVHCGALATIVAGGALACSADPAPVRQPIAATVAEVTSSAPASSAAPTGPEYVLADVERRPAGTVVPLEKGARGVLVDGARAITSEAGVMFAAETADAPITRFDRLPARLGGGFLFRTASSLYASATFDGPLRAVASIPGTFEAISFGTDALLVRSRDGRRWVIDPATGARKAPVPLGLFDVAALDDGRAVATLEAGGVAITSDGGKTWRDAQSQLQGASGDVAVIEGDLWLDDRLASGTRNLRFDRSGAFVEMSARPPATAPVKADPRIPGGDTPLRMALRSGVRAGPWTAVIAAGGNVMRVDLATGAIASVSAGVLPVSMSCDAMEVPDDIAIVCVERGKASVVMTHVLHGKEPRIERSFPTDGPFYGGDGGTLAYGGPCGPLPSESAAAASASNNPTSGAAPATPPAPPPPSVCVRNAEGQWEPFVLDEEAGKVRSGKGGKRAPDPSGTSAAAPDPAAPAGSSTGSTRTKSGSKTPAAPSSSGTGSAPPAPLRPEQVRWIPRAGRSPVAIIAGKELATYDAAWGELRPWQTKGAAPDLVEAARRHAAPRHDARIIDQRWAATSSGAVAALLDDGRAIEVSPDGEIAMWPFTFESVAIAGSLAFAKAGGGRAFQSLDRGRTWAEVASPPGPSAASFHPVGCSALGCDLGSWVRFGWTPSSPVDRIEVKTIGRAPVVASAPLVELACLPTGATETRSLLGTRMSLDGPLTLGLGAVRSPPHVDDGFAQFDTFKFTRTPVNVALGVFNVDAEIAPRAVLSGFAAAMLPSEREDQPFGVLGVLGPSRAASAFKQELAFVEPLVASAPIRRVTYSFDTITKAMKGTGVTVAELVQAGNLVLGAIVPITPAASAKGRPAPSGELLVSFAPTALGTLYLVARGGASPRAEILFARPGGTVQSAARLANGDLVALAVGELGDETILRFSAAGAIEVATLTSSVRTVDSPPNPDVIAINGKGEIAVIRTPSGPEPASLGDPALLIVPGPRLTALAPWASAVTANDPSCAGPGTDDMYRATLQTALSWVRIAGRPFFDLATTGMTARVRWSASRLCVEALDVPEHMTGGLSTDPTETVVTATFAPDAAGRAEIEMGSESRSALACTLPPR